MGVLSFARLVDDPAHLVQCSKSCKTPSHIKVRIVDLCELVLRNNLTASKPAAMQGPLCGNCSLWFCEFEVHEALQPEAHNIELRQHSFSAI